MKASPTNSTRACIIKDGLSNELSVSIDHAVETTGLPTLVVRQIWAEAVDLVSTTGQVVPAPG